MLESESLPVEHVRAGGPDHILGVEHLVEHVVNGAPLVLDVETAQHVLSVIESAETSASEGTTLYIPDFASSPTTKELDEHFNGHHRQSHRLAFRAMSGCHSRWQTRSSEQDDDNHSG
ncbi:MAG: hypothetical protein WKF82_02710 [Nocardioidaceae bacterium]